MNSQDFRNLQEAYMEVVMNEGDSAYDRAQTASTVGAYNRAQTDRGGAYDRTQTASTVGAYNRAQKKKKEKRQALNNSYDLYDIILSHLLDEGYAETLAAAEAIMVNMSEEWMGNIMEKKYEPDEELPGSGLTPSRKYRIKRKQFLKHSKDSYQGPYAGLATKSGVRIHPDDPKETGRTRAHRMTSNYNSGP